MLRNDRSRVFAAWTSRTSRDNVAGRIRFRARLSAADFWCGYVMGHSGWRTVTSTWTIDVSYQLQFARGGYAWDNCYWQIVMSVISHDYDRAPATSCSERRVYARDVRISCIKAVYAAPKESWRKFALFSPSGKFPSATKRKKKYKFVLIINFNIILGFLIQSGQILQYNLSTLFLYEL